MLFRFNKLFPRFKKNIKTSLWKKISKEKRQKIKTLENNTLKTQENSINAEIIASHIKSLVPYSLEASSSPSCHTENFAKLISIKLIYLNIIYLHHQTHKIDSCLQAMQKNPILAHAFQLSYNEFRAKFYNLLVMSADQGKNFSLALSRKAEFFSALTHFFGLFPIPLSPLGGIIRIGINHINKKNKVYNSKKLLNYCVTDENFTKVVSLLFSCILVKNLSETETLDRSIKKNFLIFWKILKEQAEELGNKPNFPRNIEKIWAYCLAVFEQTTFSNPKVSTTDTTLNSKQKNSIKKENPFCETNFFGPKKFLSLPSIPMQKLSTISTTSKFWEESTYYNTIPSQSEMNPSNALPRLITSN